MAQGCLCQELKRRIIQDIRPAVYRVRPDYATVAMVRVTAQTHVRDQDDVRHGSLDCPKRLLDNAAVVICLAGGRILLVRDAEDQDRSMFTLGAGTVAIADPDEWDDADHAEGLFNSFLTTPIIDLAGVAADTVQLRFASSWRPEFDDNYHQTANITVSFDGADPVEMLLWESDSASPNYKPYATNEAVVVEIAVPEGAQNMVVTFGCYDAGNDWWWAIDNIDIVCN